MTPEQLDELEVWLAAGFDLPTAMAAVQRDEPDESDGDPSDDEQADPPPDTDSSPAMPAAWPYLICLVVVMALLILCFR